MNLEAVNEAYNSLLVEKEDYKTLRDSIDSFDNFDTIALAKILESHELLEFRRLAAHLYKKNNRWEESIQLSKHDKLFRDAIITAAASNSTEVAEEILGYFVDIGNKECFAATLFVCFDLLRPDIVAELSWQHGLNDFYMPYKIQVQRSTADKVCQLPGCVDWVAEAVFQIAALERQVKELSTKTVQREQADEAPVMNPGLGMLMITQGPG